MVALGLPRFLKERAIVLHCAASIGSVVDSFVLSSGDGDDYQVTYVFPTADGNTYRGDSGSNMKELLPVASPITILYSTENPALNLPRELFWFYQFGG